MRGARGVLAAAAACLALGCSGEGSDSIAVVTVTAPPGMPTVTQLRVVVSNAGLSDSRLFPQTPVAAGITFATSFAVTFPALRAGYLEVAVAALDTDLQVVATGANTVPIVSGGRADVTVNLTLVSSGDAGMPGPDAAAGADTPGPDLAKADVSGVGPDLAQPGPDLRGTDGIGGTTGAGGTTSTGGATTIPPTGSGGVISTGGRTGSGGTGGAGTGGSTTTRRDGGNGGAGGNDGGADRPGGSGGARGTGGATGSDAASGSEPCVPAKTVTGGQTGTFDTTGAYCVRTPDDIRSGWGCSNFDGRTLKVNGVAVTCGAMPLPAKVNGYYYFDASAGGVLYASIYWY